MGHLFFFLQQSAEKALKALYIKRHAKIIRTHDLVRLAKELNAPKEIVESCKLLTPAYQYTRYPDAGFSGNLAEKSDRFLKSAEEVIKWAKENL